MNCPRCKEYNPKDSYYCHNCGKQLRITVNVSLIFAIIFAITTIGMSIMAYINHDWSQNYREKYDNANSLIKDKESTILSLKSQLKEKEADISTLYAQLEKKQKEISRLIEQLPKPYYTKYANQTIYYWNGSYKKSDYYYPELGTRICIYDQQDGYGLTIDGWIPMNRLEKE